MGIDNLSPRDNSELQMTLWDHASNAIAIYDQAGIDPAEPTGPHALAQALMGPRCLRYDWTPLLGAGCYEPARGERRETIWIRPRLSPLKEAWTIYHEVAERFHYHIMDPMKELACDQLAAHLRAPEPAFRTLLADVGFDLEDLAEGAVCSQTSAALRWSETTGNPLVVIAPTGVRARGEAWGWPDESELRRLARTRGDLPGGLQRAPITDARGRVALYAA